MKNIIIFYVLILIGSFILTDAYAGVPPYWVCYDYGTYTMCVDQTTGQQQFIRK